MPTTTCKGKEGQEHNHHEYCLNMTEEVHEHQGYCVKKVELNDAIYDQMKGRVGIEDLDPEVTWMANAMKDWPDHAAIDLLFRGMEKLGPARVRRIADLMYKREKVTEWLAARDYRQFLESRSKGERYDRFDRTPDGKRTDLEAIQ